MLWSACHELNDKVQHLSWATFYTIVIKGAKLIDFKSPFRKMPPLILVSFLILIRYLDISDSLKFDKNFNIIIFRTKNQYIK